MIVGIGSDLCDIDRIEETLARFGERFLTRCFTDIERKRSDRKAARANRANCDRPQTSYSVLARARER